MWPFEYKYNVQCFWLKRILNIIIQVGIFREYRNKCFWRPKAQASIFREYQNKCFWRPKCFGKAPPQIMPLQILSGKGAVQIMPFRKLGGKCHFLLRFCTRKRSETYIYNSFISNYLEFLSDINNIYRRFFHCHDLVCGACNLTAISPSQFQPSLPADYHSAVKWPESKTNERKRSLGGMIRKFTCLFIGVIW